MRPVPSVRGDRVVRALERAGLKVARVAGSHHIMRHPDGRGTTVPVHAGRDIAKGTLRGILTDTGMTVGNCKSCCDHLPVSRGPLISGRYRLAEQHLTSTNPPTAL